MFHTRFQNRSRSRRSGASRDPRIIALEMRDSTAEEMAIVSGLKRAIAKSNGGRIYRLGQLFLTESEYRQEMEVARRERSSEGNR